MKWDDVPDDQMIDMRTKEKANLRQISESLCKIGDRIRLVRMDPIDPNPQEPGAEGTVDYIDDAGTIHVQWDNGRSIGLIPGTDIFQVIS